MLLTFYRILRMLDMKQIGRNYYNPNDPLKIPQHRSIHLPCILMKLYKRKLSTD